MSGGSYDVCYNMSHFIGNQLNIDNIILSRWNTFMNNGNFRFLKLIFYIWQSFDYSGCRYGIETIKEKILPGKFRFLVQFQPNRSTNRRTPQSMTSLRQEFNPDQFNFTKIQKEKELVCQLRNEDNCSKSPVSAGDNVIINVSPIDLGHCLLVPQTEACLPQVPRVHIFSLRVLILSFYLDLNSLWYKACP